MTSNHNRASRLLAVCALAFLGFATVAQAQPTDRGRGYMMGPGMMGGQQFGLMCNPRSAGFAEWRLDRLESIVKPTDAQRAKFDEFKTVSNDGPALPADFDPAARKGLGMRIVRSFVEQIGGKLLIGRADRNQGARFTVLFS